MNAEYFQARRSALVELIKKAHPQQSGVVVLFASYEQPRYRFWQDSTFYYFTGLAYEPGTVLAIELDGASVLYLPTFTGNRSQWVVETAACTTEMARLHGFVDIRPLGDPQAGYATNQNFTQKTHRCALEYVEKVLAQNNSWYVSRYPSANNYANNYSFKRWCSWKPDFVERAVNISPLIARMRRKKDAIELGNIQKAIDITIKAHNAAQNMMRPGISESVVEAALGQEIHAAGARHSFPPIVASGARGTILHYEHNNATMQDGDLLVIDSGASWEGYAADISRTFAVSGTFTKRQCYVYNKVLETQQHVFDSIKPGMWLSNKDQPNASLHHIACAYLKRYDLEQYFVHGIGHFLGLDVHDVGDGSEPLAEGDIITLEPGIYIRDENIGVRIEDNVHVTSNGATMLSEALPRCINTL